MLFYEFFANLVSFNLQWFVELAMENVFWVFLFVMISFVYNELKFKWTTFFVVIFWFWISIPFIHDYLGLVYMVGGFFFLNYVSRVTVTVVTETIPALKGRIAVVILFQFFAVLIIYNLFLV